MKLSPEQKHKIIEQYKALQLPNPKKSLCRFYLRGLCFFSKDVVHIHGVDDLNFQAYNGQPIQWKYQRSDFNQTKFVPKEFNYVNLYEFQKQKKYTAQQINTNKLIKQSIRDQMMKQEAEKFMELLKKTYPGAELTSQILERQFTRVGFNKPTSTLNFKKIVFYLNGGKDNLQKGQKQLSKYFVAKVNGKQTLVQRKTPQQIQKYFGDLLFQFVLNNKAEKIQQSQIKKELFKVKSKQFPPLNVILKQKQQPFISYVNQMFSAHDQLRQYVCNNNVMIQSQATIQEISQSALDYLNKSPKITFWSNLSNYLIEANRINNNSHAVNPIKHLILQHGYQLFNLPMVMFIYNPNSKDQNIEIPQCPCKCKQQPDLTFFLPPQNEVQLQDIQIIDSVESFEKCLHPFISSKILAVDIQGRLRKGGQIQMIQFNNGKNVFLFDIYKITQLTFDFDLFEAVKLAVRRVMLDDSILKIFHDSRHDGLGLHQFMNSCIRNVFDTSGIQIIINQFDAHKSQDIQDGSIVSKISNPKPPGLNDLYKKYKAPHGINSSKQKFHKMMSQNKGGSIFHDRPLNQQYKQYCVKDVLDLIYLYQTMSKEVPKQFIRFVGNHYIINSYQGTL